MKNQIVILITFVGIAACGSDPDTKCTTGAVVECPCGGGVDGVQTCMADGTFGTCDCGGTDGAMDAQLDSMMSTPDADVTEDASSQEDAMTMADATRPDAMVDGSVPDAMLDAQLPDAMTDAQIIDPRASRCDHPLLANEDLESTALTQQPSGWEQGCLGGSQYTWEASGDAAFGSRGLKLDFTGSGGEAAVGVPVSWPTDGAVFVHYDIRPHTTDQNIYVLPVRNDQRMFNAVPFQKTGEAFKGGGPSYSANTWYHITYIIDFDDSTYRALLDGVEVDSGSLSSSALPCQLASSDYLSFHGGFSDQKWSADVDNVVVTHKPMSCEYNHTVYVDDTADDIVVSSTTGLYPQEVTYEALVAFDSVSTHHMQIIHAADPGWKVFYMRIFSGELRCDFGNGTNATKVAISTSQLSNNRWYHIACTRSASKQKLWLDGQVVAEVNSDTYLAPSSVLHIGSHPNDTTEFRGFIDEVRISDGVRYQSSFEPASRLGADADTLALWNFDEGTGTTVADSSGNGHTASLVNIDWSLWLF